VRARYESTNWGNEKKLKLNTSFLSNYQSLKRPLLRQTRNERYGRSPLCLSTTRSREVGGVGSTRGASPMCGDGRAWHRVHRSRVFVAARPPSVEREREARGGGGARGGACGRGEWVARATKKWCYERRRKRTSQSLVLTPSLSPRIANTAKRLHQCRPR
jgi:hypothetical protein